MVINTCKDIKQKSHSLIESSFYDAHKCNYFLDNHSSTISGVITDSTKV
jgi:hypothetical protein